MKVSIANAEMVAKRRIDIPMLKMMDSKVMLIVPKMGSIGLLYRICDPCWLASMFIIAIKIESHRASLTNEPHSFTIFPIITNGIVEIKSNTNKIGSLISILPTITAKTQIILQTG